MTAVPRPSRWRPTNAAGLPSTKLLSGCRSCSCSGSGRGSRGLSATSRMMTELCGGSFPAAGVERRTAPVLGASLSRRTFATRPDSSAFTASASRSPTTSGTETDCSNGASAGRGEAGQDTAPDGAPPAQAPTPRASIAAAPTPRNQAQGRIVPYRLRALILSPRSTREVLGASHLHIAGLGRQSAGSVSRPGLAVGRRTSRRGAGSRRCRAPRHRCPPAPLRPADPRCSSRSGRSRCAGRCQST